jgi:hypothetical protein
MFKFNKRESLHRDGKGLLCNADEKLTAFIELESVIAGNASSSRLSPR